MTKVRTCLTDIFLRVMAASYVGKRDLQLTASRSAQVKNFQQCYLQLIAALGEPLDEVAENTSGESTKRSSTTHRLTGDAPGFKCNHFFDDEGPSAISRSKRCVLKIASKFDLSKSGTQAASE